MAEIQSLVPPGEPGWRVAVATARYPDGAVKVAVRPLVGWAKVVDPKVGIMWLPAWWDDLGLSTGSFCEVVWALGPAEQLSKADVDALSADAAESYLHKMGST